MTGSLVSLEALVTHVRSLHPAEDPLVRVADAVEVSAGLSALADRLVGHFVDEARRSGASWTEIGAHLGVTKQAAQQRYVPKPLEDVEGAAGLGLVGKFTRRARGLLADAQLAATARAGVVENADLLDALASDPVGYAGRAMVALGTDLADVRRAAQTLPRTARLAPRGPLFAKDAKKTLERSVRESRRLDHGYVGTEHLLLALLRSERDPAAQVLVSCGVTHEAVDLWLRDTTA